MTPEDYENRGFGSPGPIKEAEPKTFDLFTPLIRYIRRDRGC